MVGEWTDRSVVSLITLGWWSNTTFMLLDGVGYAISKHSNQNVLSFHLLFNGKSKWRIQVEWDDFSWEYIDNQFNPQIARYLDYEVIYNKMRIYC